MATPTNPSEIAAGDTIMVNMSNLLKKEMFKTQVRISPWNSQMVQQIAWEDGVGDTGRVNVFGASFLPAQWNPVTLQSTSYDPGLQVNEVGSTEYSFSRDITMLASQKIDVTRLRQSWQARQQAVAIAEGLASMVGYNWSVRYRDNYSSCATYKLVLTANGIVGLDAITSDITSFPEVQPEAALNSAVMDMVYNDVLQFEGAFESADGMTNGAPVFTVMASRNTIDFITRGSDVSHNDWRWAEATYGEKSFLMNQLGAKKAYKNFMYVLDSLAPRYTFDATKPAGQKWIRVEPYILVPTTNGTRAIQNPAYRDAPFEDTIVFVKDVFKSMVVNPYTGDDRATFNPQTFSGELEWVNNRDMDKNYLGTQGLFIASLSNGVMPVKPRHGVVIRHVRALANAELVDANGNPIGSLASTPAVALTANGL
jgi:hypothetical protein